MNVVSTNVLSEPLRVINIGLERFADDLRVAGVDAVVQVEWSPPAKGDAKMATLLASLED